MGDVIELTGVGRAYGSVPALGDVSLSVRAGTFVAVMGATGSGKSTLLHCAAGLDRPSAGTVRFAGRDLTRMREGPLTRLRRDRIGFVFQSYNLLSALTVRQNVLLPARLGGPRGRGPAAALVLLRHGRVVADAPTPAAPAIADRLRTVSA